MIKKLQEFRDSFFQLSAIGAADQRLKDKLEGEEVNWKAYEKELEKYRRSLSIFNVTRVLFYAGLINSVASTFNIYGAGIIQQIASYIGVTVIIILYTIARHFTNRRRELYRLERELLINSVD